LCTGCAVLPVGTYRTLRTHWACWTLWSNKALWSLYVAGIGPVVGRLGPYIKAAADHICITGITCWRQLAHIVQAAENGDPRTVCTCGTLRSGRSYWSFRPRGIALLRIQSVGYTEQLGHAEHVPVPYGAYEEGTAAPIYRRHTARHHRTATDAHVH